jgi:mannose-6-phosphate isomerase-like protein (cupin superfamily)
VTEAWTSREAADAALEGEEAQAAVAEVLALLDGDPEMTETVPEGGTGLPRLGPQEAKGHALCNLSEVEDLAPRFGLEEIGEARFARTALEAKRTGISHHRLHPGRRGGFAHVHRAAEEVYVVLSGGGRVKLDDEIVELRDHDALRVAPETVRQFEAGPDGLEFLAVGPHVPGDGELLHGWWAD